MNLKKIILLSFSWLFLIVFAYCGQENRIELTDGSVVNGEVIAFANGVYTIKTPAFGEIKVESAKVSKIQAVKPSPAASSSIPVVNLSPQQIEAYKDRIMNNPENAEIITGLATDPQIQDLAQDPEIRKAAQSGDVKALMKNKKFMDAVNDPQLQEAVKKIKQ